VNLTAAFSAPEVLLELDGVSARYGRVDVLKNVTLRVPAGAAVALLGSNGAGKTSTLRVIAGQLPPTQGHVRFAGQAMDGRRPHQRAKAGICLVPEGRAIFRNLTVRENLTMQVGHRDVARGIERAVEIFPDLGNRLEQPAGTMSGGQQQMLAVARALITEPRLVMVDELSLGLAPLVVEQIFQAIETLRASGTALLIVEQYVEHALRLADYVYILNKGRIAFEGTPEETRHDEIFDQYIGVSA
jgi:branched-chain amino acid transport system ATP-binding protein